MSSREKFARFTFGSPTAEIAKAIDPSGALVKMHGRSASEVVAEILLEPDPRRRAEIVRSLPKQVRVLACRALLG